MRNISTIEGAFKIFCGGINLQTNISQNRKTQYAFEVLRFSLGSC